MLKLLKAFLTLGVIVGPLPNNIVDGQTIDAVPVMANFNWLASQVNANAIGVGTEFQAASSFYVPPGSGGTNRSVQAKETDWVSVLDYGADPTGVNNSTTAFNNAIASLPATGGTVLVPTGIYAVNLVLSTPNVTLQGMGAGSGVTPVNSSALVPYNPGNAVVIYANGVLVGGIYLKDIAVCANGPNGVGSYGGIAMVDGCLSCGFLRGRIAGFSAGSCIALAITNAASYGVLDNTIDAVIAPGTAGSAQGVALSNTSATKLVSFNDFWVHIVGSATGATIYNLGCKDNWFTGVSFSTANNGYVANSSGSNVPNFIAAGPFFFNDQSGTPGNVCMLFQYAIAAGNNALPGYILGPVYINATVKFSDNSTVIPDQYSVGVSYSMYLGVLSRISSPVVTDFLFMRCATNVESIDAGLAIDGFKNLYYGGAGHTAVGGKHPNLGTGLLATAATEGYLMIPTTAGSQTGVPANPPAGYVSLTYDTTNNVLQVYNGAVKKSGAFT